jgi:hypothetical protein
VIVVVMMMAVPCANLNTDGSPMMIVVVMVMMAGLH